MRGVFLSAPLYLGQGIQRLGGFHQLLMANFTAFPQSNLLRYETLFTFVLMV